MNWLRVLGTAKPPQMDQGVRHRLHAKMSLLKAFKPKKQPLEFILPRKGPINTCPQGMNGGINKRFPPALCALAVPRILWDVGDHAGIEHALAVVRGINTSVEIHIGVSESKPTFLATFFNAFSPSGSSTISVSLTGATGRGDTHSHGYP